MSSSRGVIDEAAACDLLEALVAVPSVSGEERAASTLLTDAMRDLVFDRAFVDAAGNAVGELGATDASRLMVLLGHIDTVAGTIPVRRELVAGREVLYGRGTVDAKGPLAAFVVAAARLGRDWARRHDLRLVVAGAVEEEAATSRGARFLRQRFDGEGEPRPDACVIGEPSQWHRLTLGYKGRLLVELVAERELSHTAGPDPGVATLAVELWNELDAHAARHNQQKQRAFDRVQPSLRRLCTERSDDWHERVEATYGLRLPPDFDADALRAELDAWAVSVRRRSEDGGDEPSARSRPQRLDLAYRGYEAAYQDDGRNPLVRSFLGAIREIGGGEVAPRFVLKTGTSDMNVVAPVWRCPILAYGPGDSRLDHTPHEHLALDDYWRAIQVLEKSLRTWAESTDD